MPPNSLSSHPSPTALGSSGPSPLPPRKHQPISSCWPPQPLCMPAHHVGQEGQETLVGTHAHMHTFTCISMRTHTAPPPCLLLSHTHLSATNWIRPPSSSVAQTLPGEKGVTASLPHLRDQGMAISGSSLGMAALAT